MDIEKLYDEKAKIEAQIEEAAKHAPLPEWAQQLDAALGGDVCTLSTTSATCIDIDAKRVGVGCPGYVYGEEYCIQFGGARSGRGFIRFLEAMLSLERRRERIRKEVRAAEEAEAAQ